MEAPECKTLLRETKVSSLLAMKAAAGKPLIWLGSRATVGELLDTLSSHGILSAPIFVSDETPSPECLLGFLDVWTVLSAFLTSLPPGEVSAAALESHGAALCARPLVSLFRDSATISAAIQAGDARGACADWDMHDDPDSSLLDVIRSCFLPRGQAPGAWGSGPGPASTAGGPSPRSSGAAVASVQPGHSRHPAASHRVVVSTGGPGSRDITVLSQSDILRFLAHHTASLRPLGRASLAELGLATGSLCLAAGPPGTPLRGGCVLPGTSPHPPRSESAVPSSPKPPLSGGSGGLLGAIAAGSSPCAGDATSPLLSPGVLGRSGSGGAAGGVHGMSPPASPRLSGHGLPSGPHTRAPARRQLVAVHESVPAIEAFRVLLQQRVSAVAVLAGTGNTASMRLVGNLSASDLRHLRVGGFGRLADSVHSFLASRPAPPDQAIALPAPPPPTQALPTSVSPSTGNSASSPAARPAVLMAHAPGVFTCQATACLADLVRMLGAPAAGIHRVYVVDPDQRPAGVVTGTDVLSLLAAACSRD